MISIKKRLVKIICILISVFNIFAVSACGSESATSNEIELYEPSYQGPAENAKPRYLLSWSLVPWSEKYEVMIHTSMKNYEGNFSRYIYNKKPQVSLVFLQGVYTNTVNYRIKVRAYDNNGKALDWSNVWEMNYVDGKCTLTNNAADFSDEDYQEENSIIETDNDEIDPVIPLEHSFPESLETYIARERGKDISDLSKCSIIETCVLRCEYSEPEQTISNPEVVGKIIDAVSKIEVKGLHDEINSTEDTFVLNFYDEDLNDLGAVEIQSGFLLNNGKRYTLQNLDGLFEIEELMLPKKWDTYWENWQQAENEYINNYEISLPANVLEKSDYSASLLYNNIESASIFSVEADAVYTENIPQYIVIDDSDISEIMSRVNNLKAVKLFEGDTSNCQAWRLIISYSLEDNKYKPDVILSFMGDNIVMPDGKVYVCTGLEELLEAIDTPIAQYLLENRHHRPINPVF